MLMVSKQGVPRSASPCEVLLHTRLMVNGQYNRAWTIIGSCPLRRVQYSKHQEAHQQDRT
jgi:hypothetical protein